MRRRSNTLIFALLLCILALIVYGSLYPFNFNTYLTEGGLSGAFRELRWARAGRGDLILNVLLYLPLGFCLVLAGSKLNRVLAVTAATLVGAVLSLSIELAQSMLPSRVPSLFDLTLNTLGSLLGAVCGLAWFGFSRLMRLPNRPEAVFRDPQAMIVIALWFLWRLAPFVPELDLAKLKAALRPLFSPHLHAFMVCTYLICWLVVNQLIASLVSRAHRLEALLATIAIVLVSRLVVARAIFVPDELLGLLLLLPMVLLTHRLTPQPRRVLMTAGLLVLLIADSFAPFKFVAEAQDFDWWPFKIWWAQPPGEVVELIDWTRLLRRLFLFGALMWSLNEWGWNTRMSGIAVLVLSAIIALVHTWQPMQPASITEPLLVAGLVVIFGWAEKNASGRFATSAISQRVRSR
ncbi:MAG TPA: VanZ family protein [Steroidobacteraceae bacterium]|nr:VanZ family protein [Steroidobacteraceae bacterium]